MITKLVAICNEFSIVIPMNQKNMRKVTKILKNIGIRLLDLIILWILFFFGINYAIVSGTRKDIAPVEDITSTVDAVLVLWASVQWLQLSPILQDRVETGIQMYQRKKAKKIIISWDNGKKYYNEVDAMFAYIRNRGIPVEDIIVDVEWYNTFDSIAHVTRIPSITTLWIVTQNFHLPRSLFIAQWIGLDSIGIVSDRASYINSDKYETRESFARIKAFFQVLWWYII